LPGGDFHPGVVIAGYRLDRLLGEGGMGVVYEATQLSLDRTVALKLVAPRLTADVEFRARFRREGLIQARVEHPNIVTVYEAGEYEGTLFLAMRLVRGASLKELIVAGELDARRSLQILLAVADALDSAHQAGLVHRDVKPHNILVGAGDHPYLADFGITKLLDATAITRTGEFLGSRDYISPEQVRGEDVTPASDIYALGAVLFECLTGAVPYPRDSEAAVLYAHVMEPQPRVSRLRSDLPTGLDAVIARAMAKESGERYQSAVGLITEAQRTLNGSTGASAPRRERVSSMRSSRAPRVLRTLLGAGLVSLVASGFLIGHAGRGAANSIKRGTVAVGHVELRVPIAWVKLARPPSLAGLTFDDEAAFAHRNAGGTLVVGLVVGAGGVDLLPQSLLSRLPRAPMANDRVQMGAVAAYRYRGIDLAGASQQSTLMVAPSSVGVIGVACTAPAGEAHSFLAACEGTSGTLRLRDAAALALGPSPSYARTLNAAVIRLRDAQTTSDELARARTRSKQAVLCRRLSQTYSAAAATLAGADPGPDAATLNASLLGALRRAAADYLAMSRAATADDSASFERARTSDASHLNQVRQYLKELQAAGYGS
jgi:hypothetical protein